MAMLERIVQDRIEKLKKLRENGINPYPPDSYRSALAGEIVNKYSSFEGKDVTVDGRIMSLRNLGKLAFARLMDVSGSIQLYFKKDNLEKQWDLLKLYDIGDFVEATGTVTKTQTGEISVEVTNFRMLAKSIYPLPEKWAGLKDEDTRFRRRYLDFLANPDSREKIAKRAQLLQFVRQLMWEKGFIEIENPSLELHPSGAEARPFITHINAYDLDVYLRICAGELWQKMSTIGGFEKVFEIARAYRNEGVDAEHNPEFTMLEFYWPYATIDDNIKLHEEIFSRIAKDITGETKVKFGENVVDLTPPYPKSRYNDLFKEKLGIDLDKYLSDLPGLRKIAREKGVELEDKQGLSTTIDQIYKQKIRPYIEGPLFLTHYPYILTPLAKRFSEDPKNPDYNYVQMSQLIICGMEMCRIYGELNDPLDQELRFKEQQVAKEKGDEETWGADYDFTEAMKYGMPPQTGAGIGLDRLAKLLTNANSLREVIPYPIMKPEVQKAAPTAQAKAAKK